ncbi:MAG: peptidoglycan glycosyltransferase [Cyanobium sp. NAT70]|nr:peptidoglycan glycosyltransferase [Cyanobium sp. NAT70]
MADQPTDSQVPHLIVHQPDQPDRTIPLHGDGYRLGREEHLEIPLPHPAISRLHALLQRRGKTWFLLDHHSTNGVWWSGRRVQELELRDGDRIALAPATEAGAPTLNFNNPNDQPKRLIANLTGGLVLSAIAAGSVLLLLANLSVPVRGRLASVQGPIAMFNRRNQPIQSIESQRHRELSSIQDFSPWLVKALLSSEDNRFWWHPGIDAIGTLRALITNWIGGEVLEGGSTLTQQLARSLYPDLVGQGDTLKRKWRELLVALQLESRFSKSELLLSYLNRVYLGVGFGFEDASRFYFDTSAKDLTLEQAALLVGLLPSPNGHDPCRYPQRALAARNKVLNKMANEERLSSDAARQARRRPIQLSAKACSNLSGVHAPYYSDQVRRDLTDLVGPDVAAEGNFLVETYLDTGLQAVVERQLKDLLQSSAGLGVSEGAAVVLDSRNGGVLAISGGRDYRFSQFNRATMALRQPGSTFKLMTYLAALEHGIQPGSRLNCEPLQWRGQRFESECKGELTFTSAFASSSNTAALRLSKRIGLEQVVRQARALGITTPLDPVPGLALGQSEVRLIELTSAYAAVANNGFWNPPTTIRRLVDAETCKEDQASQCRSLTATNLTTSRRVMSKDSATKMQSLLRAVVRRGTGRSAFLGGQEGGKTGTTNDGRDLLFIGYEPSRHWVLGIWLGNDDNSPTASSSALAAGLWSDIIRAAGPGSQSQS